MNAEIKEIKINTIGQLLDFVETEEKAKLLIDYITNLQQENEEIKKTLGFAQSGISCCCRGVNKTAHNYKWKYYEENGRGDE